MLHFAPSGSQLSLYYILARTAACASSLWSLLGVRGLGVRFPDSQIPRFPDLQISRLRRCHMCHLFASQIPRFPCSYMLPLFSLSPCQRFSPNWGRAGIMLALVQPSGLARMNSRQLVQCPFASRRQTYSGSSVHISFLPHSRTRDKSACNCYKRLRGKQKTSALLLSISNVGLAWRGNI